MKRLIRAKSQLVQPGNSRKRAPVKVCSCERYCEYRANPATKHTCRSEATSAQQIDHEQAPEPNRPTDAKHSLSFIRIRRRENGSPKSSRASLLKSTGKDLAVRRQFQVPGKPCHKTDLQMQRSRSIQFSDVIAGTGQAPPQNRPAETKSSRASP